MIKINLKTRGQRLKRRDLSGLSPEEKQLAKEYYRKLWRQLHPSLVHASDRRYKERNVEKLLARTRAYAKRNRERIRQRQRQNWKLCREAVRKNYQAVRRAALAAYGGKCACCGERTECFLSIDHVRNDGNKRRASKGEGNHGRGYQMYRWLKKHNYPQDGSFQVLCHNCNQAKQHDPVAHRKIHPNAINIDNLGDNLTPFQRPAPLIEKEP